MKTSLEPQLQIISYSEELKEMLKIINYEWIEKYFEITELDKKAFDNPQIEILDKGGYIYFVKYANTVIGSVALEKITNTQFALTRMGVKSGYQGKKIGQLLMEKAIEKSKELGLNSVVLYTNQILVKALNLYFKNGFRVVPLDDVPYKRATIKMQLDL